MTKIEELHHIIELIKKHNLPLSPILEYAIKERQDLIETGVIEENKISLEKRISSVFISTWKQYFKEAKVPSVWTPFWYMKSESYWHFKSNGNDRLLEGLLNFAGHPSIGQMRAVIKFAYLDDNLFRYIQNEEERMRLKEVLIKTYINVGDTHNSTNTLQ